jgi:vacuolar iron transporter family protein
VELANQVAAAFMTKDALAAHARDELGLSETTRPRPMQAALSSAASFILGGTLPLAALVVAPTALATAAVVVSAITALVILGMAGAKVGGAPIVRAALRVGVGGTLAIAVTAGVGHLFGAVTG